MWEKNLKVIENQAPRLTSCWVPSEAVVSFMNFLHETWKDMCTNHVTVVTPKCKHWWCNKLLTILSQWWIKSIEQSLKKSLRDIIKLMNKSHPNSLNFEYEMLRHCNETSSLHARVQCSVHGVMDWHVASLWLRASWHCSSASVADQPVTVAQLLCDKP